MDDVAVDMFILPSGCVHTWTTPKIYYLKPNVHYSDCRFKM